MPEVTERLSHRQLVWLMALLATLPVWLVALPPGTDLPQHAAQISLLLDHFTRQQWLDDIRIQLFTPYWLTYLLGALLATVLSIVTTVKVLASLSLAGTVWGTARLLAAWGQDRRLALLAIPGLYGMAYQWGFLPFNLSVVLLLCLLAAVQTNRHRLPGPLLIALLLLLTHGLTAAVAALMLLALTLVEPALRTRLRNYALILFLLLPTLAWQGLATTGVSGFGSGIRFAADPLHSPYFYYAELSAGNSHWVNGWGRLTGFFPRILGWNNGTAATLAGLALMLSPLLLGYRLNRDRRVVMLAFTLLAVLLVMPSIVNGSLYSAERFSVLFFCLLPLLLLAPSVAMANRFIRLLCLVAVCAVAVNAWRAIDLNRQLAGLQDLIADMPAAQHVLAVSYAYQSPGFIAPMLLHAGQWYGARRNGLVDPSFAATDLQPVRYRPGKVPYATIGNGFDWMPSAHVFAQFHDPRHDAYLIHGTMAEFEAHTGCRIIGRTHHHDAWLSIPARAIAPGSCQRPPVSASPPT